jgi:trehalose-6-phosphate synthase
MAALGEGTDAAWIGWNGSFSDPGTWMYQDRGSRWKVIGIGIRGDYLSKYYGRVCNSFLLPIYCRDSSRIARVSEDDWRAYVQVNRRFAAEACRTASSGATVWVNDFHLQLCPRLIKNQRPDLRVVYFHHIPFPPADLFEQIPWRTEIMSGIGSADRIGFQTHRDRASYLTCRDRWPGSEAAEPAVVVSPAEIDTDWWRRLGRDPSVRRRAALVRSKLGDPDHVFLGIDRLEPVKGIPEKLAAFLELNRWHSTGQRFVLLQVAVAADPRALHHGHDVLEGIAKELAQITTEPDRPAVYLTTHALCPRDVAVLYAAADSLVVTSLSDGMNMVVKEFVAVAGWNTRRLIVSRHAGIAEDLPADVLVDPRNLAEVTGAMQRAVRAGPMPAENGPAAADRSPAPLFTRRSAAQWMTELTAEPGPGQIPGPHARALSYRC